MIRCIRVKVNGKKVVQQLPTLEREIESEDISVSCIFIDVSAYIHFVFG